MDGLVVLIIVLLLGGNNNNSGVTPADQSSVSGQDTELADFVSVVLADNNRQYQPPTLVLFSGAVDSACEFAQSVMGSFCCPSDVKVYVDLSFYQDLKDRYGAPGDFA